MSRGVQSCLDFNCSRAITCLSGSAIMSGGEVCMSVFGKAITAGLVLAGIAIGQQGELSSQANGITQKIITLRNLIESERAATTKNLALAIRDLPSVEERLSLATNLANLATEGDNGKDTLQAVADTLAEAVGQKEGDKSLKESAYAALARIAWYENITVSLDSSPYKAALERLDQIDRTREKVKFILNDLNGKQWSLQDLHGNVVLVNFWGTWCPPCRKEMPDMETLYKRFQSKGLVILAISDEEKEIVNEFIATHKYSFPVLLDPGAKTRKAYLIEGIPKTFIYDRDGKLVATGVDQRTESQFLEMLAKAGLQ